jgi:hypothetical protein
MEPKDGKSVHTDNGPVAQPFREANSSEQVDKLREQLTTLEAKVAEVKPVQDIVRMLLYFWAAVSIVLGLFGWKQFSDIEAMVSKQVQLVLPSDKAKYAEYEKLINETKRLYTDFESLTATYKERVKDLEYAATVSKDFDIEGQVLQVIQDSDTDGKTQDPAWRTKAIFVISTFRDNIKTKGFSADLIFNVAQVCRQLRQYQLARELTAAAHATDPSPPIRAMYLASKVANTTGRERTDAFTDLMSMVVELPSNSPQIVLSEAWNAAEDQRLYDRFQQALAELMARRGEKKDPLNYVPSYAYLIKAQTHLRQGEPGSRDAARRLLQDAAMRLAKESPEAQWYEASLARFKGVQQTLLVAAAAESALTAQEKHDRRDQAFSKVLLEQ